jgi:hypothetical protein
MTVSRFSGLGRLLDVTVASAVLFLSLTLAVSTAALGV